MLPLPPHAAGTIKPGWRWATWQWAPRWGTVGLGLLVMACWMLMQPYRGITHDGTLYGVLALSHLHPGSLDHDLFVRMGVQNRYTVFTPLYAAVAGYLGLEHAAALLTLATHLLFLGCAWLLARQYATALSAWLGVGLLIVVPAYYGWGNVFAYTESFLTPRQPAEAFALAGLTAALLRRHALACVCMLVSLALHPIIAAAGIALWATLVLGLPRPRLALGLVLGATVLLVLLSAFVPKGPLAHFDVHWLAILKDRLKYLFPTRWAIPYWGPAVVPLCVLFVGAFAAERPPLRQMCAAGALTVGFGVLIAIIESDWLHVILAGQVQFWRWLWLSGVLAALLAPVIAVDCWRARGLRRAAIVLIATAWFDTSGLFAVLAALGACTFAIADRAIDNPGLARLLLVCSGMLLAFSLGMVVVDIHHALLAQASSVTGSTYNRSIQIAHLLSEHGVLPAALLIGACALIQRVPQSALPMFALGAAACIAMSPFAHDRWTQIAYSPERFAAYAPWQSAIPPGTTVLWPEDPPMDDWFVLERPSYWSLYQMAGMVFSRDDTMIGTWLESLANPVLPAIRRDEDSVAKEEARGGHSLRDICRLPDIAFVASWNSLGPTPYPRVAPDRRHPQDFLYLYHCGPAKPGPVPAAS